ncbi:MAG TPA: ECF-type sigma factor [Bryobacteraceae bacterium]
MEKDLGRIAELMQDLRTGRKEAAGQLVAAFYPELRRMAARRMRSERTPHTWQPTVLVNELYLELLKIRALNPDESRSDRDAFLGLAAHIMRRLLIHHARPLHRQVDRVELSEQLDLEGTGAADIGEIENLLARLYDIDPQLRTIVEMRVFEGFSIADIASQLNCGARTVDRRWSFARKWLEQQLATERA